MIQNLSGASQAPSPCWTQRCGPAPERPRRRQGPRRWRPSPWHRAQNARSDGHRCFLTRARRKCKSSSTPSAFRLDNHPVKAAERVRPLGRPEPEEDGRRVTGVASGSLRDTPRARGRTGCREQVWGLLGCDGVVQGDELPGWQPIGDALRSQQFLPRADRS